MARRKLSDRHHRCPREWCFLRLAPPTRAARVWLWDRPYRSQVSTALTRRFDIAIDCCGHLPPADGRAAAVLLAGGYAHRNHQVGDHTRREERDPAAAGHERLPHLKLHARLRETQRVGEQAAVASRGHPPTNLASQLRQRPVADEVSYLQNRTHLRPRTRIGAGTVPHGWPEAIPQYTLQHFHWTLRLI